MSFFIKNEAKVTWLELDFGALLSRWLSYCVHSNRFPYAHLGVHIPFYLHSWGYIQIFGGAMYPLTLHLGVKRKLTAFSRRKVMHHAVFCKYYAELANFFLLSDIGSDRKWGSVWPMAFVSVPPFFGNIVYNLSTFVFYTELNARLPIYSHDH